MRLLLVMISILFLCSGFAFTAVQIESLGSDLQDSGNITDGNLNTAASGKDGENDILFQFGYIKYIDKAVFNLDNNFTGKISLYTSDDFVNWKPAGEISNNSSSKMVFENLGLSTALIKAVIRAQKPFRLFETVFLDGPIPDNKIEDLTIKNADDNSAVVVWKTLQKSQDYLYYAKKYNGDIKSLVDLKSDTSHEIHVPGLLSGTEYQVKVISETLDGKRIESGMMDFKTTGISVPDIIELSARTITPYNAKIYFRSNVPVSYDVFLGKNGGALEKIVESKPMASSNEFVIQNLEPESVYQYRIVEKETHDLVYSSAKLGFITPADNYALGKNVTGTFNFIDNDILTRGFGNSTMERLVDGNLNYYGGMAISGSVEEADQYAVIDLGSAIPVQRVDVYWWGLSYSRDYEVDISSNGTVWESIKTGLDAETGAEKRSPAGDLLMLQSVQVSRDARFIRLTAKAGSKTGSIIKKWDPKTGLYVCEIAVIRKP